MSAGDRWRTALAQWAIPDHVLAQAPDDPHEFSVRRFTSLAEDALRAPPSVTHRRAAQGLPAGGSVLDVGCGGGAGSLPLADRADLLVGVDQSPAMLSAFRSAAEQAGVTVETVEGTWPDVAERTPVADVVVCLHVIYNVGALVPFLRALTAHARARVVLEFTDVHPLAWMRPYWHAVHGVERPTGPTADDAIAVLHGLGYVLKQQRWRRPFSLHDDEVDERIDMIRRRLAVGTDRRDEIADLVQRYGVPTERAMVTVWWDVEAEARPRDEQEAA